MFTFGTLARNTLWMILGQGVRLVVQFAYFVLIARVLHQDGYGAFSGVVALVGVLLPFAGWGAGNLLIKNVTRDATAFPVYWGRALLTVTVSSGGLTLFVLALARWILPASVALPVVFWVAVSDLLFSRLLDISTQAFQAFHQLFKTALLTVLQSFTRLAAVLLLMHVHSANALLMWSFLYMCGTAVAAVIGCVWASWEIGLPKWDLHGWRGEFAEGFYFASSLSAQRIYLESDKTLLTRLSTLEAAGVYAAATRIIDAAMVPIYALQAAAYSRFFAHGREGIRGTVRFSRRLLPYAMAYAVAVSAGMLLFAPLIPLLLGSEFAETITVVRWLAPAPLLMTLHRFAADTLTGAGRQAVRTRIEFLAAMFNVAVNLCLLPFYSWRGAVAATLLTELLLVIALATTIGQVARETQPLTPIPRK